MMYCIKTMCENVQNIFASNKYFHFFPICLPSKSQINFTFALDQCFFFFPQMHYLIPLKCWLCAQIYSFAHNNAIQTLYLFTRRSMNISFATKTHCLFSRSASTYQIQMPSPPPRPPNQNSQQRWPHATVWAPWRQALCAIWWQTNQHHEKNNNNFNCLCVSSWTYSEPAHLSKVKLHNQPHPAPSPFQKVPPTHQAFTTHDLPARLC